MKWFFVILLLTSIGCKKKDIRTEVENPDVVTGRMMMLTFAGNVLDQVSNDAGTIHKVKFTNDRKGNIYQAMIFNAADSSYLEFPSRSNTSFPNNIFTISCWLRVDDTLSNMAVLSKREPSGPFEYSIDNHFNKKAFTLDNWVADASGPVYGIDPLKAAGKISIGEWHHYAWVADGKTMTVYLDGIIQSGIDIRNSDNFFTASGARFIIGDGGGFGRHYYFTGAIDEVFVFNRALSIVDINFLKEYLVSK